MSGGCSVGQVDGFSGDGGGNAEDIASFNMIMTPIVARCATPSCHGGLQMPNLTGFEALQQQYKTKPATTNKLITKKAEPAIVNNGNMHQGVLYFDATEEAAVSGWIESIGP